MREYLYPHMKNNETLRRIRDALNLDEAKIASVFSRVGHVADPASMAGWFAEAGTPDFVECPNIALNAFLDGLIIELRGVNEKNPVPPVPADVPLDNSDVLKKLRIALDMRHDDVVATLARTGVNPTKSDIAAWFRAKGHALYHPCSDAVLKAFLTGWRPPRRPRIVR